MARFLNCFSPQDHERDPAPREVTSLSVEPQQRSAKWLLFFHDSLRDLAEQIQVEMGGVAELADLEWKFFNDGFPDLQVKQHVAQRIQSFYGCCFVMSFHHPTVMFEQLAVLYALPRMGARNFRVFLPFFPTGTSDLCTKVGQIPTSHSLARILSDTPPCPTGPSTFVVYDIHALQEQFYFSDDVIIVLKTAMGLLLRKLRAVRKEWPEKISVCFPNEGFHKRFKGIFEDDFPVSHCGKSQDAYVLKQGEVQGLHVVVVDMQIRSGDTMLKTINALSASGAAKVSVFCSHGVFLGESWKSFVGVVHKFWMTDSMPESVKKLRGMEPFEFISLAPLIANYLRAEPDEF